VEILFFAKTIELSEKTTEEDAAAAVEAAAAAPAAEAAAAAPASELGASVVELWFFNKATPKFTSFDETVIVAAKNEKKGKNIIYSIEAKMNSIKRRKYGYWIRSNGIMQWEDRGKDERKRKEIKRAKKGIKDKSR
jgi:hypothetical protein